MLLGVFFALMLVNCSERDLTQIQQAANTNTLGDVFIDGFSSGMDWGPFSDGYAKATVLNSDAEVKYSGKASLRIDVPNSNDPNGSYAGGILHVPGTGRNLTGYDALTFYAKASAGASIEIGFGLSSYGSKYKVTINGLKLSNSWTKYTLPIPNSAKLTNEHGLLYFAANPINGNGYSIWLDDVKFEKLGTVSHPAIKDSTITCFGGKSTMGNLIESFSLPNGDIQKMVVASSYFNFVSNNTAVATYANDTINVLGAGTAKITANEATGGLTIKSYGLPIAPTANASNVISLYSDVYTNSTKTDIYTIWLPYQTTVVAEVKSGSEKIIHYTKFNFVPVILTGTLDITGMTSLHLDIFTTNTVIANTKFEVQIKDFGTNGTEDTSDPSSNIVVTMASNPKFLTSSWVSVEVPLPSTKAHIGWICFKNDDVLAANGGLTDVFVDNVYFHK